MIRREGFGAVWSMPVAVAFYESIGGATALLWLYAAAYALLGFDGLTMRRRLLRGGLWLLALALASGLWPHGLAVPALHHLARTLRSFAPRKVGTGDATLLLALLAPLLVVAFELPGGLTLRLGQLLLGAGLLSYVGGLQVDVAVHAVALCAGFVLVRYFDLARQSAHGRRSLQVYLALSAALVLLVGQTPPALRPLSGRGQHVQQGYPLDIGHLDHTLRPAASEAFLVRSRAALYWQVFTAYDYTGQGWRQSGAWRPLAPGEAGLRPARGTRLVVERLDVVANLPSDPVAGDVVEVLAPRASWLYNARSGAYEVSGPKIAVVAALPRTTLAEADRTPVGARGAQRGSLQLPKGLPRAVRSLAHRIVRGVPRTVGSEVRAIIAYLRAKERYALQVPSDGGRDFVWDFLFVHHVGDCNGFSTAFVVLARADGIAARWVAGYLPGSPGQSGRIVTAADAHSWAEVWVPGGGWLPLDPTPGFGLPSLQRGGANGTPASATGQLPEVRVGRLGQEQALRALAGLAGRQAAGAAAGGVQRAFGYLSPAVAVLLLALLALAAIRRQELEILALRGASHLLGRPWHRQDTVRAWLAGRAPRLCTYVEWRLYGIGGDCPVTRQEAWREIATVFRHKGSGGA